MAAPRRIQRLNSLLREVLSEVIQKEVKHPDLQNVLFSVTSVEVARDLRTAKIYISVISQFSEEEKYDSPEGE